MKRTEIMKEVSDFLIVYLKAGKVGMNSFIKKANLNISQLDHLLMIHFLIRDDVKQFVRELPVEIRRFKTSTRSTNKVYSGEVRGQINWSNTLKERIKRNHNDRTIFSCNESIRNYDIAENLVLKECLSTLYQILFLKIDTSRLEKYDYFKEWKELKGIVEDMIRKNVYLSKVQSEESKVTNRMIQKTLTHRNPLYRKAAKLLLDYRELMKGKYDEDVLQALLVETFIFPDKEEVLFELYWTIQLIKCSTENAQLQLINGKNNLVASWEDEEHSYHIYHDSKGSPNILFHVSTEEVAEVEHPFIKKKISAMDFAHQVAEASFQGGFDQTTYWRGRPDIIIEMYTKETDELVKVVIGEVKDTKRTEYAITGLRELIDYMELIKDKHGVYLREKNESMVEGRLFVEGIDVKESTSEHVKVHSLFSKDVKLNITVPKIKTKLS
ncbi:hypothetical protein LGQ02_09795 [Bacillus shivajii]|uniref:hypothetical protein n=1 Tax=Bacillus shivajii TaxID=1983719 RepID=UPI001CFB561A|nr:hypothetical protein [Bacillus shivajii]UCZ54987.1 hypothetical protein LGQ02_09795 [Bacillus shivajii]